MTDAQLRVLHQGRLPAQAGPIALHPGAEIFGLASEGELVIASFSGKVVYRRSYRPWRDWEGGAVAFVQGGTRMLAICPDEKAAVAMLLRTDNGEVLAKHTIEVPEESGFDLIPSPRDDTWALWAGAGQDGQWTYWLSLARNRITVEEVSVLKGKEHGPLEFDVCGKEFLVEADAGLERYSFPELHLLGRTEPPEEEDSAFSGSACYLGAGKVLVSKATSSRLYVVDLGSMKITEEAIIEGHEPLLFSEVYRNAKNDGGLCSDLWYFHSLPHAAVLTVVHGSPKHSQTIALLEGAPLFPAIS